MVNLLIIGSGGREHALAWKIKQSPKVGEIFIAPGNAGTAQVGTNVDIKATDVLALADFAEKNKIDFTVVGPDDSLAAGVVDEFKKRNLKIWGPTKAAAQVESSKAFAKKLMQENNIPTAEYKVFTDYTDALEYVKSCFNSPPLRGGAGGGWKIKGPTASPPPNLPHQGGGIKQIVIKASGLALGKGVTVCSSQEEAKKFLEDVMVKKIFGDSGNEVVIEEFLAGLEFSTHAFSDGNNFIMLPASQDHKRVFDGDLGPNTGGMGTIAPLLWVNKKIMEDVASKIVKPALNGLKKLGSPFVGLLYPGLMATQHPHLTSPLKPPHFRQATNGEPRQGEEPASIPLPSGEGQGEGGVKVIEFNSRFGDPETQSYMRLLKTDLYDILEACVNGTLDKINIEWENKYACCIMLASAGYPGPYEKGKIITGVDAASKLIDIKIFHSGTLTKNSGLVTNGGRVLGVTATGDNLQGALDKAYAAIKLINFEGMRYRTDIGAKSLALTNNI